jgi:hypothetical protein
MKFWELVSMFRSEEDLLRQVLNQPEWQKYFDNYINLAHMVKIQDRNTLDEQMPGDLVMEICFKSRIKFWFYSQTNPPGCQGIDSPVIMWLMNYL